MDKLVKISALNLPFKMLRLKDKLRWSTPEWTYVEAMGRLPVDSADASQSGVIAFCGQAIMMFNRGIRDGAKVEKQK